MAHPIQDEFTNLRISRQRRYQLRHEKAGLCRNCTAKAERDENGKPLGMCRKHAKEHIKICKVSRFRSFI